MQSHAHMLPALMIALAMIAIVSRLAVANFAATTTEPPPVNDPLLANFEQLRAQLTKEFDEGKAARKATDEKVRALEQAVATSRLNNQEGASGKEKPKVRLHSILRGIHGMRTGRTEKESWEGAEYERAALSSGDDPGAGYLIQPDTDPLTISFLRPDTIVGQLGCRLVSPKGVPYRLPEVTAGASGGWVGDATAPSEDKQTTALKEMRPFKYGMLVKVDRSALADANDSVEGMVVEDMRMKKAEVADLACFTGTGANAQPTGMLTLPRFVDGASVGAGIKAIGTNGGSLTYDLVAQMIGALEDANALKGNLAFASHPKNRRRLKLSKIPQYSGDTGGAPYMNAGPIIANAKFEEYIGYPWKCTTALPTTDTKGSSTDCSPVVFGNWADAVLANWAGTEIRPLFEAGATLDQVWFICFFRMDFLIRRPASFVAIRDARINGL